MEEVKQVLRKPIRENIENISTEELEKELSKRKNAVASYNTGIFADIIRKLDEEERAVLNAVLKNDISSYHFKLQLANQIDYDTRK